MMPPPSLEKAASLKLRALRVAAGWTQEQLARQMRGVFGIPWTRDTVQSVERARRNLPLTEMLALCMLLRCTVRDLALPARLRVGHRELLPQDADRLLSSSADDDWPDVAIPLEEMPARVGIAERKLGQRLGFSPDVIVRAAMQLWGKTLTDERNSRAGARSPQGLRGHVTRGLAKEILEHLTKPTKEATHGEGRGVFAVPSPPPGE